MRHHLSRNKALTFDGFIEDWFLNSIRFDILSNLWNGDCLARMPNLGAARLIPLNKVYPDLPLPD
jgi:hypothetical protein